MAEKPLDPKPMSERSLIAAVVLLLGGHGGLSIMNNRGSDGITEELQHIGETLNVTQRELAAFIATATVKLDEDDRRLTQLEGICPPKRKG